MDIKIINEQNKTKRIYLQDNIEQNIFKIKNLNINKNIYKSYSQLNFYLQNDFLHIAHLKEYKLEKFNHIKYKMNFSENEINKRKFIYNKKKLLEHTLIIKENDIDLQYYTLIIFYRNINNNDIIHFVLYKKEKIYAHSNIQLNRMMNNFYITQDLSSIYFFYDKDQKIFLVEIEYEKHYHLLEVTFDEKNEIKQKINEKKKNIEKTKLYKKNYKIENDFSLQKLEVKIPDKKLVIITEPQNMYFKKWILNNKNNKKEAYFFIMIILIYLQKNNIHIKDLSEDNFYVRNKSLDLNYKIEEFEYKIKTDFQVYLDLNEHNTIEYNSNNFVYPFLSKLDLVQIKEDLYEMFHYNFYSFRFLKKFKVNDEKELSIIPLQNYLFMLNTFQIIYLFFQNSYIPYIILKKKDNYLFLISFTGHSLEFDINTKQKIYFIHDKYFKADIYL